jgi:RHS repeat-associated protein
MASQQGETTKADEKPTSDGQVRAPSIQLPKGGGAIRGVGEKFAANPVTGTGSMTVPIPVSPGRSGFSPQLSLSYDSGSGNGPFGFGWSLSLPSITRKTDKGLPQYRDAEESDVYILSGAEDLVPVLAPGGTRFEDHTTAPDYLIHRYRPRVEGLFARIERWTKVATGETHWRSITRDNVTTLYGTNNASRVADPAEASPNPTRVFTWLIRATYDDKGNAIIFEYAPENDDNVDRGQANERNRVHGGNRHLKRIKYGNRRPNREASSWRATDPTQLPDDTWMFEVVLDYDESHYEEVGLDPARPEAEQHRFVRASASAGGSWAVRPDPFSSHRAGYEVRTYRRCRRVLMFHHIPDLPTGEKGYDGLVLATELDYADLDYEQPVDVEAELAHQGSTRFASFIRAVTQSGYVRDDSQAEVEHNGAQFATYLTKSSPPVEFEYSKPAVQDQVLELDAESLENLPAGLDGSTYQWVDLDGEGVSGILTDQVGAWLYKSSLGNGRFGSIQTVARKPSLAALSSGRQQLIDLAGDGQLDLVALDGPTPGFYERTQDADWEPFRAFAHLPNLAWDEPNLHFVDLNGDGHADVLVTEQDTFTWHPSLAEEGFGPARQVRQPLDEEHGPRLVLADGTQSIYLADMCGDGLTDLVRIRNGAVCYWPSLGYGRFGPKVTMDNAPRLDSPDQFDQRRVRLADIDGSGSTDMIYLGRDGVRLYFNQSGNRWSGARRLDTFPRVDNLSDVATADLLGNGTACLVWSSAAPGNARRPMRYIDLMGRQKPHLLVKSVNNLGAETRVRYVPSTKFSLADSAAGKPWITRLPFPVHVVERVETYDRISRNRFITRYGYHHGYFDGEEREFRGFGMVEQFDTEEFATLSTSDDFPTGDNIDAASHVPPVHTKTWFHTGVYLGREHVSGFFAGLLDAQDSGEYYREPGLSDAHAKTLLLDDTVLPDGLAVEEEREACRALKGAMLRQEIYGRDGTDKAQHPYAVTEQNFTIRCLQRQALNRHSVFLTHAREAITYHYERNPTDPRIVHALTLEVDGFGNVLKEATVGYGRRQPDSTLPLPADRDAQTRTLITYTENRVTNGVEGADEYRTPLPCEIRTYELTGYTPLVAGRFQHADLVAPDPSDPQGLRQIHVVDNEIQYEAEPTSGQQRRLIEHARTLYRPDDMGAADNDPAVLSPLGTVEPLALPGESYRLGFTPGLLANVYQRPLDVVQPPGSPAPESLLPTPADVLGGPGTDRGGYVDLDDNGHWWLPSGRMSYSPTDTDTAAEELAHARQHFVLPHRYRDPFHTDTVSTESFVTYDHHNLLVVATRDSLGNVVTAATGDNAGNSAIRIDYRVLQPYWVTDPNGNRAWVAVDALGMVVGTAVMGKPGQNLGDSPADFEADLTESVALDHLANPLTDPHAIMRRATMRWVYDVFAYQRTRNRPNPQPAVVYSMARETHDADAGGQQARVQHSFSYSDGFGREIQKKIRAEAGPVPRRDAHGKILVGTDGQTVLTPDDFSPRWVGSGWTVFNNKGKLVRQYEPFFTDTHRFEFDVRIGVSPVLFYDPAERVVATLHPDHTWQKVGFDPWQQTTADVNDTVILDPGGDEDVEGFFINSDGTPRLPADDYRPTWHELRTDPAHAVEFAARYPAAADRANETRAAAKAAAHADTPTTAYLDTLGRPFLTVAHNRVVAPDHELDGTEVTFHARVELDIEGNQRAVRDAIEQDGDPLGRVVMRYDYDMLGNRIHQASMEAGERWMLNDVRGQPIRAWDSRGHEFRSDYDSLRRPLRSFVTGADPADPARELLSDRLVYGEQHPEGESRNLRGKLCLTLDQAGKSSTEAHDFKGNPRVATRRLARTYRQALDWGAVDAALPGSATAPLDLGVLDAALAPLLEADTYTSRTTFDALNRPTELTAPDSSVIRPTYNEANLLERVEVNLRGATVTTRFVTAVDYDAKGRRTLIEHGNGVSTAYKYDPLTFRLSHLQTLRGAEALQDLHYTYDPVGNITAIRDDAQQTIFFRNQRVEPSAAYTYDALYRLVEATGREHLGQTGGQRDPPTPSDAFNGFHTHLDHPGDGDAMGIYVERYVYDAVGNFLKMQHRGSDPSHPGWTRAYAYQEPSLLEPSKDSNRLASTAIGMHNAQPMVEPYTHDAHGNMTRMPHLPLVEWDYHDRLQATSTQVVSNGGTPETTYYAYDTAGQRARKVTEREAPAGQTPTRKQERIYLGAFEMYRDYDGSGATVTLERETLHIMHDMERIALVETRSLDTAGNDPGPAQLMRYQFGNHLGSASLELDDHAQILSYEEYTPYGSTSYQGRSQTETPKRYRYSGKERDEESGFYYNRTRYYSPWLGRWVSCDSIGLNGGINLFRYTSANPIVFVDPNGQAPAPKKKGKLGDVNRHGDQGLRGKNTPEALESEHIEPLSVQRESMRNPKTGKSPIPPGRGSAIDNAQPSVLIRKATAGAKTKRDRPVWEKLKAESQAGNVTAATASETGTDAGLARLEQAAKSTDTRVPAGARVAAIGQTDAKHADPDVRKFSRDPVNCPVVGTTDAEVSTAVDAPPTRGELTSMSATKNPNAQTVFEGNYSPVVSGGRIPGVRAIAAVEGRMLSAWGALGVAAMGVEYYRTGGIVFGALPGGEVLALGNVTTRVQSGSVPENTMWGLPETAAKMLREGSYFYNIDALFRTNRFELWQITGGKAVDTGYTWNTDAGGFMRHNGDEA